MKVGVTVEVEVSEQSWYAGKPSELRTLLEGTLMDEAVLLELQDNGVELIDVTAEVDGC